MLRLALFILSVAYFNSFDLVRQANFRAIKRYIAIDAWVVSRVFNPRHIFMPSVTLATLLSRIALERETVLFLFER